MTRPILLNLPDWCIAEIDRIAMYRLDDGTLPTREQIAAHFLEESLRKDAYTIRVAPWAAEIVSSEGMKFRPVALPETIMSRWIHGNAAMIRDRTPELKGAKNDDQD